VIPLRDSIPASRPPVVTWLLIGSCSLVFLAQLADRDGALFEQFGMVPARVLDPAGQHFVDDLVGQRIYRHELRPAAVPDWLTLVTCTFLHGGWLHFLGNMLFLWIFGDNVEDRFGRLPFLLFYLGSGVAASAAHLATAGSSTVPTIGASGAIAGVMGAYMLLYPRSRVQMLVIWGFFVDFVVLPAPFFLGYWFLLQLLQGSLSLGHVGGGVAWWAHIGGFVIGAAVAGVLKVTEHLRPEPRGVVLVRRRVGHPPWQR
jgi:hypothetical protein